MSLVTTLRTSTVISLTTLTFVLSGCGLTKNKGACNAHGEGMRLAGYTGESLASQQLSLVFLEGPGEGSAAIGEYLHEHHIEAAFFVKGEEVHSHHKALHELSEQGHKIGTGGFSFAALKDAQDPVLEMRAADQLITPFAHGNQFWYYGEPDSMDKDALEQILRAGLGKYVGPIHADTEGEGFQTDAQCWAAGVSADHCAEGYFTEIVRIGHGIIPFHDEDERSLELLKILIPQLISYGFSFVPLDQVPELRLALSQVGATPDAGHDAEACDDYK